MKILDFLGPIRGTWERWKQSPADEAVLLATEDPADTDETSDESIEDHDSGTAEEVAAELDAELDAVLSGGERKGAEAQHESDSPAALFGDVIKQHSRPIKDFIVELRRGTVPRDWIDVCRPVMRTIIEAAESLDMNAEAKHMIDLDEALDMAQREDSPVLEGDTRDLILSLYKDLAQSMPDVFVLEANDRHRQSLILHGLLRQIPGVGHVTFERLYGAGFASLETLFMAGQEDLSVTTGIPLHLSGLICDKVREHRELLERLDSDESRSAHRGHLNELLDIFAHVHSEFERSCDDEVHDPKLTEDRHRHRMHREACVHQIDVVLAEMGEMGVIDELRKLPYERRIERLQDYLRDSSSDTASPA